jgi:hypothetical protein
LPSSLSWALILFWRARTLRLRFLVLFAVALAAAAVIGLVRGA